MEVVTGAEDQDLKRRTSAGNVVGLAIGQMNAAVGEEIEETE